MGWQQTRRWKALRLRILARDGYLCQIRDPGCTGEATDVDHVVPWTVGGPRYDPANLRAACAHCNRGRQNRQRDLTPGRPSREW